MNARQEAKFKMQRTVEHQFDENPTIVAEVAAFQAATEKLKAINVETANIGQLKDVRLVGIALGKTNFKQTAAQLAADVAGFIYAFASVTGNEQLKQEANFNHSKLIQTRDNQFAPRCQNIHDRALENLDALKDYGVTAEKLAELKTAIDTYAAETPKPRTAVSRRKTHNANLAELFKQADALFRNELDKLINAFRTTHPDFVKNYESNRIIIDPSTTTTQLKGKITDKSDGSAVGNAEITVVELSKTTKSNSTGNYNFKPINAGKYTIRVTKIGFNDFEILDFDVKLGDITSLDVEMVSS